MGARRVKSLWGTWTIYSIPGSRYLSSNLPRTCRVRLCPGRRGFGDSRASSKYTPETCHERKTNWPKWILTNENVFKDFVFSMLWGHRSSNDHHLIIIRWYQLISIPPRAPLSSSICQCMSSKNLKILSTFAMPKCKTTSNIYNIYIIQPHINSVVTSLCDGFNRKWNHCDLDRIRTSRAEALWGGTGFGDQYDFREPHLRPQNHALCESGRRNFIGCISHELASLRKCLVALITSDAPNVRRRVKIICQL